MKGEIHVKRTYWVMMLLVSLLTLAVPPAASAATDAIQVRLNGQAVELADRPVQRDNRVLVPMRGLFEALGAKVEWIQRHQTVYAEKQDTMVILVVGSSQAAVGAITVELDAPARIINDRIYVPLRFVGETLGADVRWDSSTHTVWLTQAAESEPIDEQDEQAEQAAPHEELGDSKELDEAGSIETTSERLLEENGMYALTQAEQEMASLVNEYRKELGLPEFRISRSLTKVARYHVYDSNKHNPFQAEGCNLHSWSNEGEWTGGCYTSDHANAELMWHKPGEISGGVYNGNGYEISYWHSWKATPSETLAGFKGSPGHNNVIIGDGYWARLKVMGVAIEGNYAHIWFGEAEDPNGYFEIGGTS
jgi:hypothetical protein